MSSRTTSHQGFTLVEILVVIVIILIVSALTLPTVLSALSHRQVSESARILQAALAGARDAAIRNNAPSGIRLLPDPVFNGVNASTGQLDSGSILAANRLIPIEPAPAYHEGLVTIDYEFGVSSASAPLPGAGRRLLSADRCRVERPAPSGKRVQPQCLPGDSQPADFVVLEHPPRRPASDQQRRAVVHGRRADERDGRGRQLRAFCQRRAAGHPVTFDGSVCQWRSVSWFTIPSFCCW